MTGRRRVTCGFVSLIAAVCCATVSPPQSKLMKHVGRSDISPAELRIRVRALAGRFMGLLEILADDLVAGAPGDLKTRLAATRFKINAIPAMQMALLQPDPVAALIDAWALVVQIQQSLPQLGTMDTRTKAIAAAHLETMEDELERIWGELTVTREVSVTRQRIHDWAAKHPLVGTLASRESTAAFLSKLTANEGVTALGAAASLIQDTADLSTRLDLDATFLPKQARWEAEYMILDALTQPAAGDVAPRTDKLLSDLTRLTGVASEIPALVERERIATLKDLHDERIDTQKFLDLERQATVQDLRQERIALIQSLRDERSAVFVGADHMVGRWGERGFDAASALVDRVFRWLLLLCGLLVIGGWGAAYLFLSYTRHPPRAPRLTERHV